MNIEIHSPRIEGRYFCPLCGKAIYLRTVSYGPILLQCDKCRRRVEVTIQPYVFYNLGTIGANNTTGA